MNDPKIDQSLSNLGRALDRLGEALAVPEADPLVVDATIQRFEFSVELFWKTLRRMLVAEGEGVDSGTPRETLKHAYRVGWINDEATWVAMLKDRNLTSHVYNDEMARQIYRRTADHYRAMRAVFDELKRRTD